MTLRTLRILLLVDILSLVVVAAIHAGIVFGGPFERRPCTRPASP